MFGNYSYLISIGFFAGIFDFLTLTLFYKLLRPYFRKMVILIFIGLILTPLETFALRWRAWDYDWTKNMGIRVIESPVETYFFSIFCGIAVGSITFIWSFYVDKKNPVLRTWIQDTFKARYAFWNK